MTMEFCEGNVKITKDNDTFFNPAQKLNRDISLEVIKEYFKDKESFRILTSMSATGLRGIRYLNEINNAKLYFNDICEKSVGTIQKNLVMNGYNDFNVIGENESIRNSSHRINITKSDCHVLMNQYHGYFDCIDIDPFGSCAEFVNAAYKAVKHNGLICFTCTDKAALCTNETKCFMKYNTTIKKVFCKNETPIRVLLSYISREFAKYDAKIIPVVSLSVDFYVRVIVRVFKRQGKAVTASNSFVSICDCYKFTQVPMLKAYGVTCTICDKQVKLYGPFWTDHIHDNKVIQRLLESVKEENNERMIGILRLMNQEIPSVFYYEIPRLSSLLKIDCCKLKDIMNGLANAGYLVSLTHCDNNSFKTDASTELIIDLMKEITSKEMVKYSIKEHNRVKDIFDVCYYKGKVKSGLGPLALPKQ